MLLRPLPYPDIDRLVRIVERLPARTANPRAEAGGCRCDGYRLSALRG